MTAIAIDRLRGGDIPEDNRTVEIEFSSQSRQYFAVGGYGPETLFNVMETLETPQAACRWLHPTNRATLALEIDRDQLLAVRSELQDVAAG